MKFAPVFLFVLGFCYVECLPRKALTPLSKHANVDFINMESGGVSVTTSAKPPPSRVQPGGINPAPIGSSSAKPPVTPAPVPTKPNVFPAIPAPTNKPAQPQPAQIAPKPVNPAPAVSPITTPLPGSVKHLINYYDSQGKASVIRPYSYSQAVKQG